MPDKFTKLTEEALAEFRDIVLPDLRSDESCWLYPNEINLNQVHFADYGYCVVDEHGVGRPITGIVKREGVNPDDEWKKICEDYA